MIHPSPAVTTLRGQHRVRLPAQPHLTGIATASLKAKSNYVKKHVKWHNLTEAMTTGLLNLCSYGGMNTTPTTTCASLSHPQKATKSAANACRCWSLVVPGPIPAAPIAGRYAAAGLAPSLDANMQKTMARLGGSSPLRR